MTQAQFIVGTAIVLLPIFGAAVYCVALLERIEKHLRELHVRALGPLAPKDRTPEGRAIRAAELGLDDGYPFRQMRGVLWHFAVVVLLLLSAKWSPWSEW